MAYQDKSSAASTGVRSRASLPAPSQSGLAAAQYRIIRVYSLYQNRIVKRIISIIKDISHPQHSIFTLLPSGRHYRSVKARTSRLRNSFCPQAIRLVNDCHPLPLHHSRHRLPLLPTPFVLSTFVVFVLIFMSLAARGFTEQ